MRMAAAGERARFLQKTLEPPPVVFVPLRRDRHDAGRVRAARTGGDGRSDDTEELIRRRQEVYAEQTEPLIDVYRDRGLLIEVDGMGEVDEVTERIFKALEDVTES